MYLCMQQKQSYLVDYTELTYDALPSLRVSKNPKPEFSRISWGGSMSFTSTCCIDFDMSSTVNGMLRLGWLLGLVENGNGKKEVEQKIIFGLPGVIIQKERAAYGIVGVLGHHNPHVCNNLWFWKEDN